MRSTSSIPHAALATSGIFAPASPSSEASLSAMSLTEPLAGEGAPPDAGAAPREAVGGDGALEACGGVLAGGWSCCGCDSTLTCTFALAAAAIFARLAGGTAPSASSMTTAALRSSASFSAHERLPVSLTTSSSAAVAGAAAAAAGGAGAAAAAAGGAGSRTQRWKGARGRPGGTYHAYRKGVLGRVS